MDNATTERLDPLGGKLLLPAFLAALVLCAVVMLFAGGEARAQEERTALDQYSSVTADTSWVSELQKIDEASPVEVAPIEGDPVEVVRPGPRALPRGGAAGRGAARGPVPARPRLGHRARA